MKTSLTLSLLLLTLAVTPRAAAFPQGDKIHLTCNIGPVSKMFGGSRWLVYGCNDGKSIALVSAPDNPALPYYFFFSYGPKGMAFEGQGTGDKQATAAALKELKDFTEKDVATLFQQAKAHGQASTRAPQHNYPSKRTRVPRAA